MDYLARRLAALEFAFKLVLTALPESARLETADNIEKGMLSCDAAVLNEPTNKAMIVEVLARLRRHDYSGTSQPDSGLSPSQ